jgi:hypothetical protein
VATGVDSTVEAANGNKRFTWKIRGHGLLLDFESWFPLVGRS